MQEKLIACIGQDCGLTALCYCYGYKLLMRLHKNIRDQEKNENGQFSIFWILPPKKKEKKPQNKEKKKKTKKNGQNNIQKKSSFQGYTKKNQLYDCT